MQRDPTLSTSLAIRNRLAKLLVLAHEISLVALNAKISAAQLKAEGAVFSVWTHEIQMIAAGLRATVENVRELTRDWTQLQAAIATKENEVASFQKANATSERFDTVLSVSQRELERLNRKKPRMIGRLVQIVEEIEQSLRVVDYVTVGIMMESERLPRGQGADQPFEFLAQEMRSASTQIREMAAYSAKQMASLEAA